jgi:DNA replicative helicase MCM subunit Mcm2 (Cdc46/Mcm family)
MADQSELLQRIVTLRYQLHIANTVASEISCEIRKLEKQLYDGIEPEDTGLAISKMAKKASITPDEIANAIRSNVLNSTWVRKTKETEKLVIDIIRTISGKTKDAKVPVSLVIDAAEKLGMDKKSTMTVIDRMRHDGDVFEPLPGVIQIN